MPLIRKVNNGNTEAVLSVENLRTYFFTKKGIVKAVDDISFDLNKGEILCIIGESGSGKTATALSILRLIEKPGEIVDGSILFQGKDILKLKEEEMRKIRGNKISMIFQDASSSLNPVLRIGDQINESLMLHLQLKKEKAREKAIDILTSVGIPHAGERLDEYPHQFSGGMKQRVMIAMALSCSPLALIADEPTTALDVTIQAQILDIFKELKSGISILYITHDLAVVSEIADRIIVMYSGKFLEEGDAGELLENPKHPYMQGLMGCLPSGKGRLVSIPGSIPSLIDLPPGCVFNPRCTHAMEICKQRMPGETRISDRHSVRCYLYGTA
ncbi:MAG: ABC transporter ATP-binding protein [Candidatus Methanoperedens sp.]|nr:ABC transporter ATP-binding protein [Candidatus Methanoperedens sp.]MCZ7370409.1 ABC transporter ATP-binding protein [Candidatus Methanoperedens sp.]